MIKNALKNTFALSLFAHLSLFALFSFSFGQLASKVDYAPLVFWGQILSGTDLRLEGQAVKEPGRKIAFEADTAALGRTKPKLLDGSAYNFKPAMASVFGQDKDLFLPHKTAPEDLPRKKESSITLHPLLPYPLQLYFKDRQAVHIELMFNIVPRGQKKSIVIKRKISSGNLEADLLSARYMGHYLFNQQARFLPDNWQTVKIDLSAQK